MKNLKITFVFMALLALALAFTSCGNADKSQDGDKTEQQGKEYTSAFICPMHCEGSGSDHAGTCPKCNMDYVANNKIEAAEDHSGHDHGGDDHEGHNH